MRFPVGDKFAIALSGKLYDLLARQGQPLPRAVAMTLNHLAHQTSRRFPALSMAAPAVFGATAAGLTLKAPRHTGTVSYATENLKMAGCLRKQDGERHESPAISPSATDRRSNAQDSWLRIMIRIHSCIHCRRRNNPHPCRPRRWCSSCRCTWPLGLAIHRTCRHPRRAQSYLSCIACRLSG